jgi:hydroxymethylglutaryl-CoA lyase/(R)-citramalyl-CoA lyase
VRVTVCDVGPRDGLQNEPTTLPPETRSELVNRLAGAGVPRIEAVSFVNPARVPAMAGAEEVIAGIDRRDGLELSGLVLNERGYDRLRATELDRVSLTFAATDSFSRRNANQSVDEALAGAGRILARARADGLPTTVTISVAFGCPFEGAVAPERVLGFAEEAITFGADEVVFADTIGVATPTQVRHLVVEAVKFARPIGVHLHNTRSTGLANAWAGLEWGATIFDGSVGGIGGCPFAPRATGNVATEDLLYMLQGEGVDTGVDLDALIGVAEWLEGVLGRELPGQVYRAGTFAPLAVPKT